MNMLNISYASAFFVGFLIFVLGLGLGALIHSNVTRKNIKSADKNENIIESAVKNGTTIVCFDYKVSKDYDRLYDLLNNGQTVLTRNGYKVDKYNRWFYNSWKGRDDIYYLSNNREIIEDKEKFVFYCKFKDIEFLDFVDSK